MTAGRHTALCLCVLLALQACSDPTPSLDAHNPPVQLSQWQLLHLDTVNNTLVLDVSSHAYDLATPLFSDYALKLRTIRLPEGQQARPDSDGQLAFPVGTVISKTFYYPRGPDTTKEHVGWSENLQYGFDGEKLDLDQVYLLETRLLVHQHNGWTALPYVWNAEQSDATLQIAGDIRRLTLHKQEEQIPLTYIVPNRNECAACHRPDQNRPEISPLGPTIRNLNRMVGFGPHQSQNQLEIWQAHGLLSALPPAEHRDAAALWEPQRPLTPEQELERRARSYLDVNCAHCHQPGGSADTSGLFLNIDESSPTRLGICKPPVAAGRGTGGHRFSIVPGSPEQSILVHRMLSTEVGVLMPELGRTLVHEEGLELVKAWITRLSGDCD